jgi:hypothetical protein
MADNPRSAVSPGVAATDTDRVTGWVGWVLFAGIVLFTAGLFNIIEGLIALFKDNYYVVHPSGLVLHVNYTAWGWTLLIFGLVMAVAGYGVATGQMWARVVGIIVAAVNALVNLGFLGAYPIWITITIALNVIVIYALIVHGREAKALRP